MGSKCQEQICAFQELWLQVHATVPENVFALVSKYESQVLTLVW